MSKTLTIDCGGSKTAITIWQSSCAALPQPVAELTIPTDFADEQGLLPHLQQLCAEQLVEAAVLAVAGPTNSEDGRLGLTNNSCRLDLVGLRRGLPQVERWAVLNDLEAFAHALPAVEALGALEVVNRAADGPGLNGVCLAVAAGTGLGVAARLPGGRIVSTEAGHCSWAPENQAQVELWQRLRSFIDRPCYEDLLSGRGLVNILRAVYPASARRMLQPAEVTACALGQSDASPELVAACRQTFQIFSELAGTIFSNLALCYLSSGGVYIGGGVIAKIGALFDPYIFRQAFAKSCPFQAQLQQLPVYLIRQENTPSLGAACYAEKQLLG